MPDINKYRVPPEKLRWSCDPNTFTFECTADLEPLQDFIGQDRAVRAIQLGLAMDKPGYNIFVTGLTGTGKTSAIKSFLEKEVAEGQEGARRSPLRDWCFIYNLDDPDRPKIIDLPKGRGRVFHSQMQDVLQRIKAEMARLFSSEEYQAQRNQVVEEGQSRRQKIMQDLEKDVMEEGFLIQALPQGMMLAPHAEGRPMSQAEYFSLEPAQREELERRRNELAQRVGEVFHQSQGMEQEIAEKISALDKQIGEVTLSRLFNDLEEEYKYSADLAHYLRDLRAHTLSNIGFFREQERPQPALIPPGQGPAREADPFLPFQVNVFVDNSRVSGPPIVIETNPTYGNVFGKIERRAFMGAYFSDQTMLKAGALAVANGGYLVLNIKDVLINAGVWEGLKRAIKNREVRLEDPFEQFGPGVFVPQGLRPEPIPIDVKVIIIGDNRFYQGLSQGDEDFWEIFKIKADFDSQIPRTDNNLDAYARFICAICTQNGLLPFDRSGAAKVLEYGARMVSDQEKLTARFGQLRDIIIEADYWARHGGHLLVTSQDVDKAVQERVYRVNLVAERIRELIANGTLMIDLTGSAVGQVNGLAVLDMGDFAFGKSSRITAKTFMGRNGVINIERESQLSGKTHDKGVLILSGYLGWKYAQQRPLSLAASVCFEQSYDGIDGDSASSTELYAILSSLSELPIRQDIAVTGSVNQRGEVQPIGGVNEKIEGFYDICKTVGLTGDQGVMVPQQNLRNLTLREDVVEAVRDDKFHIYAVRTIDEGIEALTGVESGAKGEDGSYPKGTVNFLVDQKLKELAEGLERFSESHKNGAG